MEQPEGKVGILFELGEARRNRDDWPDYLQYGFDEGDVENLLALIADSSLHEAPVGRNGVWVPLHAWRTLGQLGNPRAIEPMIEMFNPLCDDDWALEELPRAVAMIGRDAIGPLTDFMGDTSNEEFARAMAVSALEEIVVRDPSAREEVVTIVTDYLEAPDVAATVFNGSAVSTLITLQAQESIDTLRRLYASGYVDIFACGDIEEVEIELGLRTQRSTPPKLSNFFGFDTQEESKRKKVGRNDPCPCGSGKKYKKCCLH